MKPICIWCGDNFPSWNSRRFYCSQECKSKMKYRRRPLDLVKYRNVLAHIIAAAAKFLAPKIYLTVGTLKNYFCRRVPKIYDWRITYFDALTDF